MDKIKVYGLGYKRFKNVYIIIYIINDYMGKFPVSSPLLHVLCTITDITLTVVMPCK